MEKCVTMLKKLLPYLIPGALLVLIAGGLAAQGGPPADYDVTNYRNTMIRLVGDVADLRRGTPNDTSPIFEAIAASGDALYIAPLIDILFFARTGEAGVQVLQTLTALHGERISSGWQGWFEWASEEDLALPPHYDEFKGLLFSTFIDPEFARFWQPGVMDTARVNLLEPVWGGVRVDGIPSLVNASQISPEAAMREGEFYSQFCREDDCSYPAADELVFGVSIDGDSRAYPLRQLNWHEMFNDIIGHMPLYDAPNGALLCNYRAPVEFRAIARDGDAWVQIRGGAAAGCPLEGGWLANPADLVWLDADADWMTLPDVAADEDPLSLRDGMPGTVPGRPVMLAYCTLCGSGILYDATVSDPALNDGEPTVLEFGSTGMLMRSNKLMYDRLTDTVWNALTGVPAFGPLVETDIRLDILPVVVTDWATWLEEHPDTSVLSLDTGFSRDYTNGAAYGDYFNSPDLMFPVFQQDTTESANKDVVFALLIDDTPKAYPLEAIIPETVTNDTLADTNVVIIARETPDRDFFEPGGAAVRAYDRGDFTFSPGETEREVIDQDGTVWQVTEAALVSPDGDELPRLGGHLAFWFGWFSFHPDTLVYAG